MAIGDFSQELRRHCLCLTDRHMSDITKAIGALCGVAANAGDRHPLALGARPEQVIGLVMRNGLGLVAIGLVLGLAFAAGAARLTETLLFDVRPLEPVAVR